MIVASLVINLILAGEGFTTDLMRFFRLMFELTTHDMSSKILIWRVLVSKKFQHFENVKILKDCNIKERTNSLMRGLL